MKIQRYIAKDMRSALAQVREALGADAVILSSGRVGEEVEVIAAVDFEAVQQAAASAAPAPRPALRTALARFFRVSVPGLHVLAWNEVPDNRKVRMVTAVGAR